MNNIFKFFCKLKNNLNYQVSGIWYEHKRSINNWDNSDECGKITWNKPKAGVSIIIYNSLSKM